MTGSSGTSTTSTKRLTAAEIEQAIHNAGRADTYRSTSGRLVIRSVTDGGRRVVVIADYAHDGIRPITAWEED